MKMKKLLCQILISMMLLILCGCGDVSEAPTPDPEDEEETEMYEVDYLGCKDDFKKAKDSYEEGKKVTLYYDIIATDTDYTFYLDDEVLDVDYSDSKGYIITFIMPDHDVTLRVESRNTMEPPMDELLVKLLAEAEASESDVISFIRDDFDGDGTDEAFAIIGKETEEFGDRMPVEGAVWFVGAGECKQLHHSVGLGINNEIRYMTEGGVNFVMFDEIFVSESYTYVYYVEDSNVKEAAFSGYGWVGPDDKEDRFMITDSSYDMYYDPELGFCMGHTWKRYYFFYDDFYAGFYEYAGTEVDADTAEYWCGFDIVDEFIPGDAQINDIFCRGNGLIVINYEIEKEDGCIHYYHYIYDFLNDSLIDDYGQIPEDGEPCDGVLLNHLVPGMESYPEVPGPGDTYWYGTANG